MIFFIKIIVFLKDEKINRNCENKTKKNNKDSGREYLFFFIRFYSRHQRRDRADLNAA